MTAVWAWVIGKSEGCDLRLPRDPYVSDRHARIALHDDWTVTAEDLGSTNGTYILRPSAPDAATLIAVRGPTPFVSGELLCVGRTLFPHPFRRRSES